MRGWFVAVALIAACKGKDKAAEAPKVALAAPTVTVAAVLAKNERPPVMYVVDQAGTVRLAAAKSWAALDANDVTIAKKVTAITPADRYVREAFALGRDPLDVVPRWDAVSDVDLALEETPAKKTPPAQDDPPPPPPEEDDGSAESGGTGTMVSLDESKMGNRDSTRAEGQYRMKNSNVDPQIARQQAIDEARRAGILGEGSEASELPYAGGEHPRPKEDGLPTRVAQIEGRTGINGQLAKLRAMIVIDPAAKAATLLPLIAETGAAIAVSHEGKLRPLDLDFSATGSRYVDSWIEVRVSAKSLAVESVPDIAADVVDLKQLADAVAKARAARCRGDEAPVDVLVDGEVDVQRAVDVVVALRAAGAKVVGLGAMPPAEELARRGHRIPALIFGYPSSMGDLDKAVIRKTLKQSRPQLEACYATARTSNPNLGGTVITQFFITPNGTVAAASANGINEDIANCFAGVIKKLEFPKPTGGGGVQVNYPFTMRP